MSAVEKEQPEAANTRFAKDQLKAFVERIERLENPTPVKVKNWLWRAIARKFL